MRTSRCLLLCATAAALFGSAHGFGKMLGGGDVTVKNPSKDQLQGMGSKMGSLLSMLTGMGANISQITVTHKRKNDTHARPMGGQGGKQGSGKGGVTVQLTPAPTPGPGQSMTMAAAHRRTLFTGGEPEFVRTPGPGKGAKCTDTPGFRDAYGTCATYTESDWCTDGTTGSAWQTSWGLLKPEVVAACCACGKLDGDGDSEFTPPPTPPSSPPQPPLPIEALTPAPTPGPGQSMAMAAPTPDLPDYDAASGCPTISVTGNVPLDMLEYELQTGKKQCGRPVYLATTSKRRRMPENGEPWAVLPGPWLYYIEGRRWDATTQKYKHDASWNIGPTLGGFTDTYLSVSDPAQTPDAIKNTWTLGTHAGSLSRTSASSVKASCAKHQQAPALPNACKPGTKVCNECGSNFPANTMCVGGHGYNGEAVGGQCINCYLQENYARCAAAGCSTTPPAPHLRCQLSGGEAVWGPLWPRGRQMRQIASDGGPSAAQHGGTEGDGGPSNTHDCNFCSPGKVCVAGLCVDCNAIQNYKYCKMAGCGD